MQYVNKKASREYKQKREASKLTVLPPREAKET